MAVSVDTGNSGYGSGGQTGFFEYTGVNDQSSKILALNSSYVDIKVSRHAEVNI